MLEFVVLGCILLFLIFLVGAAEFAMQKSSPAKLELGGIGMSDDKNSKAPQERKRISLNEDYEVRYWSKKFGVTPEQLRDAVHKVGNSTAAVEQELKSVA